MITEFHIASFTDEERKQISRLNDKYWRGINYTQAEESFRQWYDADADRQYGDRESLKHEGWRIASNEKLSVEERARGVEMVIYSHWHRAMPEAAMSPEQYAGCWLEANGEELLSQRLKTPAISALLRNRYPLRSVKRLKPGYTYVWSK
jgi:hypothetical protein